MEGDRTAEFVYAAVALVLVVSSLFARRMPMAQWLRMAALWVAIFAGAFVLFLFREAVGAVWARATQEVTGSGATASDGSYRIRRSPDGHYRVRARVNGTPTDFVIDTGATVTALSSEAARSAGVAPSGGFPVLVQTANGIVEAQRTRIARFEIGPIARTDMAAHIGEGLGGTNLLGMNFLGSLRSWRVEDNTLILTD